MFDAGDIAFLVGFCVSLVFVVASIVLERQHASLKRRGSERAFAMYVYYHVPLIVRVLSCSHRILWLACIHVGWLVLCELRCEERIGTFVLEARRYRIVAVLAMVACAASLASYFLDCRTGTLVVAFVFAGAWVCITVASYALELRVPRPHRERELVASLGMIVFFQACALPFIDEPWGTELASVVGLLLGARLLVPHLRRAIGGDDNVALYEVIYEKGGAIYGAREALLTPLAAPFLAYCETKELETVRIYRDAIDQEHGAILEGERVDSSVAASALERLWPSFVKHQAERPRMRVFYDLEDSDSEDESEDESE